MDAAPAIPAAPYCTLEAGNESLHHLYVSKVERMDAELRERFQAELPQIRDWLDDFLEAELQGRPGME